MCVKERAEAVKSWWGDSSFVQTQFATILAIAFACGVAHNILSTVKDEVAKNTEVLHRLDKKADVDEVRILRLEKEDHHRHDASVLNQ
jgi:hypothetical protein